MDKEEPSRRLALGRPIRDEAQTLAPSGMMTACTLSTLTLASQARKYGLGLVFATQVPCTTGYRAEMAQAKGSDVPDISRLRAGQFYAASEGLAFEKLQTPLCLSYHLESALTAEEVIPEKFREIRAVERGQVRGQRLVEEAKSKPLSV